VSDIEYDIDEPENFATPEADEVFQAEPVGAVPVEIKGEPIAVKVAGGRQIGLRSFFLSPAVAQRILDNDPRRSLATIVSLDTDLRLGLDQGTAQSTGGQRWPANVPLPISASSELWASSITSTSEVTVVHEYWAR
jgi:hypothetical protein